MNFNDIIDKITIEDTNGSATPTTTTPTVIKPKNYRVKSDQWFCSSCDIYCNSDLQFEVHFLSQKHKIKLEPNDAANLTNDDLIEKKFIGK